MRSRFILHLLTLVGLALFGCTSGGITADHSDNNPPRITIDQVVQKMNQGDSIVFLDTRNDIDWGKGKTKIPGAIRVRNNEELAQIYKTIPKDQFIVTYCT